MSRWFVSTLKYGGLVLAVVAAVALMHNQAVANVSGNVATAGYLVLLIIGVLCLLAGAAGSADSPSIPNPPDPEPGINRKRRGGNKRDVIARRAEAVHPMAEAFGRLGQ